MLTIGVDAHSRVHQAVAQDAASRVLGHWRGPNGAHSWSDLLTWARNLGEPRQWGIEGAWNYGRGLAQYLVAAGETVYEVNPRWTAEGRRSARRRGKSDALDAQAVARLVAREAPELPRVTAEDRTSELDLLVTEREAALAEATRLRNQLHGHLRQLDPEYRDSLPALTTKAGLAAVECYATDSPRPVDQVRVAAVRRLSQRLRLALEQADELEAQIEACAAHFSPLTRLCGISLLTAGALAGILGPGQRFPSDAHLATYGGVAPLEASSAGRARHRLNRGGNRRLNAILYRIALTQLRDLPTARAYHARRLAEGKTSREATRALKRFILRAIWRLWQLCVPPAAHNPPLQPS